MYKAKVGECVYELTSIKVKSIKKYIVKTPLW